MTRGTCLALLLCVLFAAGLVLFQLPGETRFSRALQNSGHGLGFALLAFFSLWAMRHSALSRAALSHEPGTTSRSSRRIGRPLEQLASLLCLRLFAALFALGIAIEGLQHMSGREASVADLLMNFVGMIAGGSLFFACRQRLSGPHLRRSAAETTASVTGAPANSSSAGERCRDRYENRREGQRGGDTGDRHNARSAHAVTIIAALVIGVSALFWCLRLPIAIAVVDALAPELPLFTAFERPFSLAKFAGGETPARLTLTEHPPRWAANRTTVLEAVFPPAQSPGFRLVEPPADWRGYGALSMSVANLGPRAIRLRVRVDQRAIGEDIYWYSSAEIEPGVNEIRFDLESMQPDVKLLDRPDHEPFFEVSQILFYLWRNRDEVTLLFDDIGLLPQRVTLRAATPGESSSSSPSGGSG